MVKKIFFLCTIGTLVLTSSCKKADSATPAESGFPKQPRGTENTTVQAPMPETQTAPPANGKYPAMEFETKEHDFGAISDDHKVEYTFNFKNTGEADLLISNAVGSCGCTVPEFPKEPVKPGESGKIKVSFNPSGKNGNQQKNVTLTANTKSGKEMLIIKAAITPKA